MSDVLRHPGAKPRCTICHGLGLQVVRDGELACARPCRCVSTCPACGGSGFVAIGDGFRAPRRRCDCARVEMRRRLLDDARLPGRYAEATLSGFDPKKGAMAAFIGVNACLKGWQVGHDNRGLVLYGKVGRGKTHLMIALLRELILRHGISARFVEFTHLLSDLKLSFERGGTAEIIEPLATVDVLAIDELGKGRNTDFEGTVLDELISRRYNAGRAVFATTNYEPGPATGMAAANNAEDEAHRTQPALVDRVSERVYSRLREMCDFLPVQGEDHRELLRQERARRP